MYPLDGVRVLALENGVSAPLCTRILGDLGADVIKIERPNIGDVHRHWDSIAKGFSAAHVWLDRNKRSFELDLKDEHGKEAFLKLAETADIIVQNFSPGVVDRLGIGYDQIREHNEQIIYINISGYGNEGEYKDRKAYDLVMQGETGLILMNGHPDHPAKIPISICDINSSTYGVISALAALHQRSTTNIGQEVNIDMFTGMLSWLGYFPFKYWYEGEQPKRVGMKHHIITPYGPHKTSDDDYINFAILSDEHWRIFCEEVIEKPEIVNNEKFTSNDDRIEHRDELESLVEDIIASEPRDHWAKRFEKSNLPWGDINNIGDVLSHPRTLESNMIRTMDSDVGELKYIDNPIDMSEGEIQRKGLPKLGEHTIELLEELGYSEDEIDSFLQA